jgi:hypothetical protein
MGRPATGSSWARSARVARRSRYGAPVRSPPAQGEDVEGEECRRHLLAQRGARADGVHPLLQSRKRGSALGEGDDFPVENDATRPPNAAVSASVPSGYDEVTTVRLRVHNTGGRSPPTAARMRQPSYFISAAQTPSVSSGAGPGVASIGAINRIDPIVPVTSTHTQHYRPGKRTRGRSVWMEDRRLPRQALATIRISGPSSTVGSR